LPRDNEAGSSLLKENLKGKKLKSIQVMVKGGWADRRGWGAAYEREGKKTVVGSNRGQNIPQGGRMEILGRMNALRSRGGNGQRRKKKTRCTQNGHSNIKTLSLKKRSAAFDGEGLPRIKGPQRSGIVRTTCCRSIEKKGSPGANFSFKREGGR